MLGIKIYTWKLEWCDLQKAYDSISWDFLHDVLIGFNFHPCFIHWVMTCVTSATFTLSINGGTHGFIKGRRGLRQGDPMSPSLFLLCMEYLSRLFTVHTLNPDFRFHAKCDLNRITHLAFADDLLMFGYGNSTSMQVLADAIEEFKGTSGLTVNCSKSQIFFGGVCGFEKIEICRIFGFSEGTLPVKYLGLPLAANKLLNIHYNPLLDQITSFINRWFNSCLSLAGRAELVRSVLQGVECFWIQSLPLPVTISDRINSLIRKFPWGSKSCPIAWKKVCMPKDEGGLGLRDLATWNKALHTKILWNIHCKADSLWIRWIHTEFIKNQDPWLLIPHPLDSPFIKNIFSIRDLIVSKCAGDIPKAKLLLESWYKGNGTAEAYEFLRVKGEKPLWYRAIWKSFIPPKFSITLWFALHGRLKTIDRLPFASGSLWCALCNSDNESNEHLFFRCPATLAVWNMIKTWLNCSGQLTTISSAIRLFQRSKAGSGILRKARWVALAACVNHLWYARNLLIHEDKPFIVKEVVKNIQEDVYRVLYSLFSVDAVMSHMSLNTR